MNNDIITAQCAARLHVSKAAEVITEVARRIADALEVSSEDVRTALTNREQVGSTGLAHGVAIPHCGLPDARSFVVGIITTKEGIAFGAIDGAPTDIFVFVAGPEHRRTDHVRFLASITARLREDATRREIRDADNADRLNSILRDRLLPAEDHRAGALSVLVVYVQDEELYEPLLESVSGEPNASVTVSEARSAGSILHRMPLFATFWNEQETGGIHRIEVILPRNQINRAVGRLEELVQGRRGVQISAFDLSYGSGVLDL